MVVTSSRLNNTRIASDSPHHVTIIGGGHALQDYKLDPLR